MNNRVSARFVRVAAGALLLVLGVAGWMNRQTSADSTVSRAVIETDTRLSRGGPSIPIPLSRQHAFKQAGQQSTAEKTIDQAQKNIQVLKGLPESQLIPMMNLMSASLGVRCNYCHVNKGGDNWVFDADDKPEKSTAREMITMVFSINKTNFRGNTEVSCFTCHRGRTGPVSVPTLPLPEPQRTDSAGPGPRSVPGAPGPATGTQPTADDILARYVAAIGGQAAIDKLKTRVMKGTYAGNGMTMTYEVDQATPDKFYVSYSAPRGTMERGFDGTTGWEKNPVGVREIAGQQLAELKRALQLFADVKLKEQFTRMNVGRDKIDGRDVYVIRAATADKRRERLFFDAETSLLLRRISVTETPIGVIPEEIDFEDYRDVEGLKIAFTVRVLAVDSFSTATRKFTEIKLNVPLDDAKFNKPAAPPAPSQ
jgi:photosynthetic reaction center cytochrome c subunit